MRKYILSLLFLTACSPESPKNFFAPFTKDKKVTDGNASDIFDPKADILFVVDDSGSMDSHQRNLASNVSLFTSIFLKTSILDYNIGVVTTDNEGVFGSTACCGVLVGSTKIVTKTTPNAIAILQSNLMPGIGGSGREAPFEGTSMALSPTLLAGANAGFIRPSAALIVIFITDAEDQSHGITPQSMLNELMILKNNDKRRVLAYGAIIPTTETTDCPRDGSDTPLRLEEFLDIVPNGKGGGGKGDNLVSLCATDYGQRLAEFALQIVDSISSKVYLTRLPDPNSLRVSYGAIDLPMDPKTGWSYSPAQNAILLGPNINWTSQPPGSKVEVHYKEARG